MDQPDNSSSAESIDSLAANFRLTGSDNDFDRLAERLWPEMYRIALGYVSRTSPEDAKDIVQNVFLRIYRKPSELVFVRDFRSYALKATKNESLNWLRNNERTQVTDPAEIASEQLGIEANTEQQERFDDVKELVEQLSPEERAIYDEIFTQGLTLEQAAIARGANISAIFRLKCKLLEWFKNRLKIGPINLLLLCFL